MNRNLIVNADDFNLTPGSARAILESFQKGIVSSTSVFTNFNFSNGELNSLKKSKTIGVGLHLNVTLDRPLARPELITSLVRKNGCFKKYQELIQSRIHPEQLLIEYELQLLNFRALFGRNPDHLNTHHHLHADKRFCAAVGALAAKHKIPVRRSGALLDLNFGVRTSDYFFGSLSRHDHWTEESLLNILRNLSEGTTEIMCHPAYLDQTLRNISSFSSERKIEYQLFSNPRFRKLLRDDGVILQSRY